MSKTMLILSPHPDDSLLAVGGTMLRFVQSGGHVAVLTIATHMPPLYPEEIQKETIAEATRGLSQLGVTDTEFLDIPALTVAQVPPDKLHRHIAETVARVRPQILLMPFRDRHTDHQALFDAAMVIARPVDDGRALTMVAAYETVSATHYNAPHIEPNFTPNWIVDISSVIEQKLTALRCCSSQMRSPPHPRSNEAVHALARFRGSQMGIDFGEGLHILRFASPPESWA